MTNTSWYIALGLVTVLQLALLLKKSDNRLKLLALFFVFYGIALLCETVVFIYLKSYDYYPKVFVNDQFKDSLFGNLFSQASIACTGLMIAFFDLNIFWVLVIIAVYYGVESAFLAAGVYVHHWFRSWMTSAGLLLLFWFNKRMYRKFFGSYGKGYEVFFRLAGFFSLNSVLFFWNSFIGTGIFDYSMDILPGARSSWASVALFLSGFLFAISCWAYETKRWYSKAALFLFGFMSYYAFMRLGLFRLQPGWFAPFTIITIAAGYFTMVYFGRYIKKNAPP